MRNVLPSRRASERFDIDCRGNAYTIGIGYSPIAGNPFGGGVQEIFIDTGKAGTDLRLTAHELAVVASLALQYGCPREVIQKALPRTENGEPEGILGTVLDYLAENDIAKAFAVAAE